MKIQAVKTTGIYCRADCGARPNPKNVATMTSPVAAMAAGYRPCLVCRPDRLPSLGLDQPSAEIAHAVRLIAEGFLDDADTPQLAARVGYSPRQLTRLFEKHIGASPDFVARARRAHLARRLLDESELTVTQVAFAAGFSSLRQMNRVMKELFAFSPRQLRSKRSRKDTFDPLDGGLRLRVPFDPPLDARAIVSYLGSRAIPGVEQVVNHVYRRTLNCCGHAGIIEIEAPDGCDHLQVTLHLPSFGSILNHLARVRNLFRIGSNSSHARSTLRKDRALKPLVNANPGIRLPGAWDRFETSIRIIVGQQISVAGANTIIGRLVTRLGVPIDADLPDELGYLFPGARQIADADLSGLGMPGSRSRTLQAFAQAVAAGTIDLTRADSLADSLQQLQKIQGIGPWTAHLIAARVMGHPDAFPASDLGLRRIASSLFGLKQPLDAARLESISKSWQPHRATAAAYLWMIGDRSNQANIRSRAPSRRPVNA